MTITTYPYEVTDQVFPLPPMWTIAAGSLDAPGIPDNQPYLRDGDIPGRPGDPCTFGADSANPGYHYSVLTADGAIGMRTLMHGYLDVAVTSGAIDAIRNQYGSPSASGSAFTHTPNDVFGDGDKFWMESTGIIGLGSQPWDASTRDATAWQKFEDLVTAEYAAIPAPTAPAPSDPGTGPPWPAP